LNIYDEAILVQDACNPSGVAHFLLKCFKHIRDVEKVTDTAAMCQHPLFVLVVNKLESLAGHHSDNAFSGAYDACKYRSADHDHHENDEETSKSLPGHPASVLELRYATDDDFIKICEDIGRQPKE
jgi:hypothetical protein